MASAPVVTSQPVPSAPKEETLHVFPESAENVIVTQPYAEKVEDTLNLAEAKEAERRRREEDFCCFACANTYTAEDDAFCWYLFCRWWCESLGWCCQSCSDCTESCCTGCGECMQACCCCDDGAPAADAAEGCCDGDCDCDCGDCDCGGCDCDCFN